MKKNFFQVECGYLVEKKGDSQPLFNQVHGREILNLASVAHQRNSDTLVPEADGAFSRTPFSELHVYTADCLPVLIFTEDSEGPISAVHAGWKGIKLGIVSHALTFFQGHSNVHVVIGPSIGACCFAVREDFIRDWEASGYDASRFLSESKGRTFFDLLSHLKQTDLKQIPEAHIHLDFYRCTVCSSPELPSFRRNKSANPRLRSFIRKLT